MQKKQNKNTSYDRGHKHRWKTGKAFTSVDAGHRHKIDQKKCIALPSRDGHTHRLLGCGK